MSQPYEYTRLEVRQITDGELIVTISLMRADGQHKYPRMIQAPWKHYLTVGSDVSVEQLFWRMRRVIEGLSTERAEPPAPPEGATGGQ